MEIKLEDPNPTLTHVLDICITKDKLKFFQAYRSEGLIFFIFYVLYFWGGGGGGMEGGSR